MKGRIEDALKRQFKPEFLNRLDDIIIFHKLSREDAMRICEKIVGAARQPHEDARHRTQGQPAVRSRCSWMRDTAKISAQGP